MAALLPSAGPNLVQTLAGFPALDAWRPFANIAHGCNSVVATNFGLSLADLVVTEAGFGADLGAEKFLDIKCRSAGLAPDACGGRHGARLEDAWRRGQGRSGGGGCGGVAAWHRESRADVENMQKFGLPVVVALNAFTTDTGAEFDAAREAMAGLGTEVGIARIGRRAPPAPPTSPAR